MPTKEILGKELMEEFEKEFKHMKEELKFSPSLDELDKIFFIRDYIMQSGFVSKSLSRSICSRIRDTINQWVSQLHAWIVPNPASMIAVSESKIFSDREKEKIMMIMKGLMAFSSQNIIIGLTRDKAKESKYIDDSVRIWNDNLPHLIEFSKRVSQYWSSQAKEDNPK